MNNSEIIKALECCTTTKGGCKECPMKGYEKVDCQLITATEAYKLIKRQQAEIERLNIDLKAMRGAANSYKAHYEDLKSENLETIKILKTAKFETVKEFAESLKESLSKLEANSPNKTYKTAMQDMLDYYFPKIIDDVAKEMRCNDG